MSNSNKIRDGGSRGLIIKPTQIKSPKCSIMSVDMEEVSGSPIMVTAWTK